jgi:hypothetical protein
MAKGQITIEDARLVYDFATHVQPILRSSDCNKLLETAKTVTRIAYCAIAEARANARAERAQLQGHFTDSYTTEVAE